MRLIAASALKASPSLSVDNANLNSLARRALSDICPVTELILCSWKVGPFRKLTARDLRDPAPFDSCRFRPFRCKQPVQLGLASSDDFADALDRVSLALDLPARSALSLIQIARDFCDAPKYVTGIFGHGSLRSFAG